MWMSVPGGFKIQLICPGRGYKHTSSIGGGMLIKWNSPLHVDGKSIEL